MALSTFLFKFTMGNLLRAVFCGAVLLLFFPALKAYPGSSAAYVLFTLFFTVLFLSGFRAKRIFFDTFAGGYLWLGFWFKLSAVLVVGGGNFGEPVGEFDFSPGAFDRALYVASCGAAALLAASFIRERFFVYPEYAVEDRSGLAGIYARYRPRIWWGFILLVLAVAAGNIYFGFYQRGLPPRTFLPFGFSSFYTLGLLFGLGSISAVLLDLELRLKRAAFFPPAAALLECFLSSLSMLSRGMILNGTAILLGLFAAGRFRRSASPLRYWAGWVACFAGLFAVSVFAANYMRIYSFKSGKSSAVSYMESAAPVSFQDVYYWSAKRDVELPWMQPFIHRWVGMEGVMSVSAYPGLGPALLKEAWAERFSDSGTSFYDSTVLKNSCYNFAGSGNKHFITLPGVIAFLYYPGSMVFLFFGLFVVAVFAAGLEFAVYRLSGANLILVSLLAQVIASRLAHFGYAPARSYMLLGGLLAVSAAVYVINWAAQRHFPSKGERE